MKVVEVREDETGWKGQTENYERHDKRRKKKAWETERADRERRAYHLCVGGHKLRKKKKKTKKRRRRRRGRGEQNKREDAEKKEGERRESGQRVKWITGCFNWNKRKQGQRQSKTVDMIQSNNTEKDAIVVIWMDPMLVTSAGLK